MVSAWLPSGAVYGFRVTVPRLSHGGSIDSIDLSPGLHGHEVLSLLTKTSASGHATGHVGPWRKTLVVSTKKSASLGERMKCRKTRLLSAPCRRRLTFSGLMENPLVGKNL